MQLLVAHDTHNAYMETLHRRFYSALNNFHCWNIDRRHIEYDQALIFRWVKNYNIARSIIIDATDKASNATVIQMTNLLWTKATRARTLAANGTFSRNSSRWATPMERFRKYLAELTQEPILTPEYRFPTLNRRFVTREEIEDEQ
jgi:hypothetical protein